MKKIVSLLIGICFLFAGCGIVCGSKPPKRAYLFNDSGYGMPYHAAVYRPASELSHNPATCTKYEYYSFQLYFDHYGTLNGDEIIWKNFQGGEIPFVENGEVQSNITVTITKDKITISGFNDNTNNGEYPIEKLGPETWGVPYS